MKKVFVLILTLLFVAPAFGANERTEVGGDDACELFFAINAPKELMPSDGEEYILYSKEIWGLSCFWWETKESTSNPNCKCVFSQDLIFEQLETIYDSINTWEKCEEDLDTVMLTKTTGELTFKKTTYVKYDRLMTDYDFSVFR